MGEIVGKNKNIISEFYGFLSERKKWWLAPIIIMFILVGILLVFSESSAISPFVYTIF